MQFAVVKLSHFQSKNWLTVIRNTTKVAMAVSWTMPLTLSLKTVVLIPKRTTLTRVTMVGVTTTRYSFRRMQLFFVVRNCLLVVASVLRE